MLENRTDMWVEELILVTGISRLYLIKETLRKASRIGGSVEAAEFRAKLSWRSSGNFLR